VNESVMTVWRRRYVREHGSARLNEVLAAGDITVNAAWRAAKYLSHDEQEARLAGPLGSFSRDMGRLHAAHIDKNLSRQITAEEWALIQELRKEDQRP
jgi:hypothetical protein